MDGALKDDFLATVANKKTVVRNNGTMGKALSDGRKAILLLVIKEGVSHIPLYQAADSVLTRPAVGTTFGQFAALGRYLVSIS
jgi:hypothetical protein